MKTNHRNPINQSMVIDINYLIDIDWHWSIDSYKDYIFATADGVQLRKCCI